MLKPHHIETIGLLVQGYNYGQIAHKLGLTLNAIEKRAHYARLAMGASNNSELVYKAMKKGLLK